MARMVWEWWQGTNHQCTLFGTTFSAHTQELIFSPPAGVREVGCPNPKAHANRHPFQPDFSPPAVCGGGVAPNQFPEWTGQEKVVFAPPERGGGGAGKTQA